MWAFLFLVSFPTNGFGPSDLEGVAWAGGRVGGEDFLLALVTQVRGFPFGLTDAAVSLAGIC